MDAARQNQLAFFLTGTRSGAALEPLDDPAPTPALLVGYRDLPALRYDYPVVLIDDAPPDRCVQPLCALVDEALAEVAREEDGQRVSRQVLRLEEALRRALAGGARGSLSELWRKTAAEIGARSDAMLADSLDRAFAALPADGALADCDAELPDRMLLHVWAVTQNRKARSLADRLAVLAHQVENVLQADHARSESGRSASALHASLGGQDAEAFDFDVLASVLQRTAQGSTITPSRRQRLEWLIATLQSFTFDTASLRFDRCTAAIKAWQERYPVLVDVARAIAIAELEVAGDYREDRHGAFFEGYGEDSLPPEDLALFPDTLVCVHAAEAGGEEQAALMDILSAGLPMKVLVQTDDILEELLPAAGERGAPRGARHIAPRIADMAMGLTDVFVLQAGASHLPGCIDQLADGMAYAGAALFSIYSGAGDATRPVPPYLAAAAAVESRAFPVFAYDPAAGRDQASRFSMRGNPAAEADWSSHEFDYENEQRRRQVKSVAFTFVDFAALDSRARRHLARVPAGEADDSLVPVAEALEQARETDPEKLPSILMVDHEDQLTRALVDRRLLRAAGRCRDAWHRLQELAGIHNSHAERALEAARVASQLAAASPAEPSPQAASADAESPAAESPVVPPEPETGEPYIETPRCTTCNECTGINDRMFAYDENRQAYIADPDAGTYAELIEAAESCQVSIIHPGQPRNPAEAGLDALLERAEPFQ